MIVNPKIATSDNYWETYAPVVKCSTIRLLVALVANDMLIEQVHVKNAYIKSELMNAFTCGSRRASEVMKIKCANSKRVYMD